MAAVGENPALDPGAQHHSRYMVENNVITHNEDPANAWYTKDGNAAGTHGNVAVAGGAHFTGPGAIDRWMAGPFHAFGVLNPAGRNFGFGQFDANVPCCRIDSGATLDVLSDAGPAKPPSTPVFWPGNGANVPLLAYSGGESPDPEQFCPPHDCNGLPLTIQTQNWKAVSGWSLHDDRGSALELYEFDGSNTASDAFVQSFLQGYGGAVLFPRRALVAGHTYTVSVTIAGQAYAYSFTTNPSNHSTSSFGYTVVTSTGGIYPFGSAQGHGGLDGVHLNAPVISAAPTYDHHGYWLVAGDGGIFPFGNAGGYGSTGNIRLNRPVVGMAATPTGHGYWLVASDGGIFPFGDAGGFGSTGGIGLNQPVVGMAATPSGRGYWLVASDGGIFPFGDAGGYGSTGGIRLNKPVVGMAATASGHGYWLVASDGGIFPFGDAGGYGSTGGIRLNQPIRAMVATPSSGGYWLVASDGGIFPFGDARGIGSTGDQVLPGAVVGFLPA